MKISRKEISRKEKKIPTHPPNLFPPTHRVFSHVTPPIDRTPSVSFRSEGLHEKILGEWVGINLVGGWVFSFLFLIFPFLIFSFLNLAPRHRDSSAHATALI